MLAVVRDIQRETSPHTRGELAQEASDYADLRNIPAYAGRTPVVHGPPGGTRKHPRIRGENHAHWRTHLKSGETSPHTRGEQQHIESLIPFCTVFSMQASF